MDAKLVIPSNEPHVSHKARIARTWQQYYEVVRVVGIFTKPDCQNIG